jgi:hypothetical protein
VEKLVELWYKIPREKEWWIDKISALLSGCTTGCLTLVLMYVLTVVVSIAGCAVVAHDMSDAVVMGLAWGTSLWLASGLVGGSAFLTVYTRLRGS